MKTGSRILFFCLCLSFAAAVTACKQVVQDDNNQSASQSETKLLAEESDLREHTQKWVTLDPYKFRLVTDFHARGQSRLEFYIHDAEDIPLSGATGTLHLTKPHGPEAVLPLVEAYHSYYASAALDDKGLYVVSAQIIVAGKKFLPRFSFYR